MSSIASRKPFVLVVVFVLGLGLGILLHLRHDQVQLMPSFQSPGSRAGDVAAPAKGETNKIIPPFSQTRGDALPGPAKPKGDVNVFVPRRINCQFHLPIQIPGKGSSKICTYDPNVDREISHWVKAKGQPYSQKDILVMLEVMREDVAKSKTHGSDIGLVDVGCNIGLFTLTAALNGYRVLAIDAMNSSLQLVATSLRLANLTSRVTMLHNAISDRHRDVVVQVRLPNNIGASWVLQASSDKDNNTQNVDTQTVVKAICLDDLVDYVPTRRIFLKMDIEASEWLALRCADRFFSELDVPYFHMEWFFYTTKAHHQHGAEIVSYLTKRGYQAFHPNDRVRALSVTIPIKWPPNIIWIKR